MQDLVCVRCKSQARDGGIIAGNILCLHCQGEWALAFDKFLLDGAKAAYDLSIKKERILYDRLPTT